MLTNFQTTLCPLTYVEFNEPKLQIWKLNSFKGNQKVSISSEKPEWLVRLFVCCGSYNLPRKMCKTSKSHWFPVLKKNDMITGQTWIWRRQRANQIRKHFNHAVEVRKICYQVVQRKQLEEISSKVDRFQSLVLHSLYAWVVPGTTDDCALLQRQGQERHHSLSAWLPLSQSWRFRRHFPCPDELVTWEESSQPRASSSSGSPVLLEASAAPAGFAHGKHLRGTTRCVHQSLLVLLSLRRPQAQLRISGEQEPALCGSSLHNPFKSLSF